MQIFWYIRTVPLITDTCQKFDDLVLKSFEEIIACGLSSQSIKQIQLSTKFGGAGLRSSKDHAPAAYISSSLFVQASSSVFPSLSKMLVEDFTERSSEVSQQNDLSHKIYKSNSFQLSSECNFIDKARILCCSDPHASAWIRALPTSSNKLTNLEWVLAMKRWLGIPIYNKEHMCIACHKQIMGIYGHPAAVCPVSGDRISSNTAWAPVKEKPFLVPFSSERPAAIFIPNFTAGKGLVVDFACTCPIQQMSVRSSSQI